MMVTLGEMVLAAVVIVLIYAIVSKWRPNG